MDVYAHQKVKSQYLTPYPIVFLTGAVTEEEASNSGGNIANRIFISKFSDLNAQVSKIKKFLGL